MKFYIVRMVSGVHYIASASSSCVAFMQAQDVLGEFAISARPA